MLAPQLAGVSGPVFTLRTELTVSWASIWNEPIVPSGPEVWNHACASDFRNTPAFELQVPNFSYSRSGALALVPPALVPTYSRPANVVMLHAFLPAPRSRSVTGAVMLAPTR